MVTILEPWSNGMRRYAGLSTDTKPSDARNGDSFVEMDTGNVFMFDAENAEWHKQVSGGGGGGGDDNPTANYNDVIFIDYDGTIRYSYSAAQFANLSALPENPTHEGLTAQGWNWELSDAKTYVASNGSLTIGQMYITADNKTRLYCRFSEGRLSPYLGIGVNGTAEIDWGDGTPSDAMTGTSDTTVQTVHHTYQKQGDYIISITVNNGNIAISGYSSNGSWLLQAVDTSSESGRVYLSSIKKIHIGKDVKLLGRAFAYCGSLESVTLPKTNNTFENNMFYNCSALKSLTIQSGASSIGNNVFISCSALSTVAIPKSVTSIGATSFSYCYSLRRLNIPSQVATITSGMARSIYALSGIVIPSSITNIDTNAFVNCTGLGVIRFKSGTPPTVSNVNAWSGVPADCIIYVPNGKLTAYTSAQNYPNPNSYTYVEESA